MRIHALLLAGLVAAAGPAWAAEPKDKAPPAKAAALPDNRHDPEDRGENASAGASAPEAVPGAATDLGKEADKEEDAYRPKARGRLDHGTRQATNPKVRNLR